MVRSHTSCTDARSFIACIGYIMLMTVPFSVPGVLYFAVFITAAAVGPLIGTTIAWTGNTWGNHCKPTRSILLTCRQKGSCHGSSLFEWERRWHLLVGSVSNQGFP